MEVNQVRFGNYTIGNSGAKNAKKQPQQSNEEIVMLSSDKKAETLSGEKVLDAMNAMGIQNRPQINTVGNKEVNPSEFLSEERMEEIEAMMKGFENGVNQVKDVLSKEFPQISESNKNALAARIFARE